MPAETEVQRSARGVSAAGPARFPTTEEPPNGNSGISRAWPGYSLEGSLIWARLARYSTGQSWGSPPACAAIFFAVLCFNLVGDTLRDVIDPRTRGRGT